MANHNSAKPLGLYYQPDIISPSTETLLLHEIDANPFRDDLSRRVQHYGYLYNYKTPAAPPIPAPPFPPYIRQLAQFLVDTKVFPAMPNQCIVNEYTRTQGIGAHSDADVFGEPIVTISLGAEAVMTFKHSAMGHVHDQLLAPRSIAIMRGDCRYKYTHELSKNIAYMKDGVKIIKPANYRRVSITFRSYKSIP